MKFLTPILQGLIVLLIMGALGWGFRAYGQFERFDNRLELLEKQVQSIKNSLENVPLCRK